MERLSVVLAGHVDHGKSTLIGRLLHDRNALPTGKVESIQADCRRRGAPFEWSFVTDALQAERGQGVTIDASHIWLRGPKRDIVLIDAPGHHEFIRNMITGAAAGDAALLIIDAREGIAEQSRRHAYILCLLGIRQVAIAINKMDLVGFSEEHFNGIGAKFSGYLAKIGLSTSIFIPTAAPDGDNVVSRSNRMPWYTGPTVNEALEGFMAQPGAEGQSLRFRVQDIYKFDERRIIAGRIDSGRLAVGESIVISPSNQEAHVVSFESWGGAPPREGVAGQSVGITIDRPLFVERGELISHARDLPIETNTFTGRLFWLSERPLEAGRQLTLRLGTAETQATIDAILRIVDHESGLPKEASTVQRHEFAEVVLRTRAQQALDSFEKDPRVGRFMLLDNYEVVGGGTINPDGYVDQRPSLNTSAQNIFVAQHRVTAEARTERNNCTGSVFWLTGLSGAGKSTIAMGAEHALFRLGYPVYVLDGDNLRRGLNTDLGFNPEDRAENIRRAGEVAALFADAGLIVITAFISPYRAERNKVRRMVSKDRFHEIHVKASVSACEARDPKGLYVKARAGTIREFTGVSAPYEVPEWPDMVLDTEAMSADEAIATFVAYCREHVKL
jgi:bifunctional enzyme CysN/CysC